MNKISIILHNHNRASILRKCLASVERQSFRPLEVVILDAGSSDGSLEVIASSSRNMAQAGIEVKCVACPPLGVAASRNLGARNASGDLHCFLDNDALFVSPESAGLMADLFGSNPALAVVSFRILKGDTSEIDRFAWVFRRPPGIWSGRPFRTFTFAGCGFCVRASAFSAVGGFWEHLKYSREEEDLSLALLDKGWELRYAPEIVVRHYFDARGRMNLLQRRQVELRNGILVLWRRFPLPLAFLAIAGRIGTMTWRVAVREEQAASELVGAVSQAVRDSRGNGFQRVPVSMNTVWRYILLHLDRSAQEMYGKS